MSYSILIGVILKILRLFAVIGLRRITEIIRRFTIPYECAVVFLQINPILVFRKALLG